MNAPSCSAGGAAAIAARLALGDDPAEHAQEVGECGVLVLLHELAGLPELDREDLGGGWLVVDELQVGRDEPAQLLPRRLHVRDGGAQGVVDLPHPSLEQRDQQVVLALEVEVDGPVGDARFFGDVGDFRGEEAVAGKDALGRGQDAFALVARLIRR